MATVHVFYGLMGSGKTTLARRLEAEERVVRLTLDEWMIRLYPGLNIDDPGYGPLAEGVRALMWDVAAQVLRSGVDVALDWNVWSIERRRWVVQRASAVGAEVVLHWVGTPEQEASARAQARRVGYSHPIPPQGNVHLSALMEEPTEDEGIRIVHG